MHLPGQLRAGRHEAAFDGVRQPVIDLQPDRAKGFRRVGPRRQRRELRMRAGDRVLGRDVRHGRALFSHSRTRRKPRGSRGRVPADRRASRARSRPGHAAWLPAPGLSRPGPRLRPAAAPRSAKAATRRAAAPGSSSPRPERRRARRRSRRWRRARRCGSARAARWAPRGSPARWRRARRRLRLRSWGIPTP